MNFITEWGQIAGIAGIALGIFFVLFREIIRKSIFPKLTKKQSFIILITVLILVFSMGIFSIVSYQDGKSEDPAQVTVLVHGEKGRDQLVLPNRGKVKLLFGDANVVETINDKGEATFKQVPLAFFDSNKKVEVQFFDPGGEPYRVLKPDSLYTLTKGEYIALPVKLYGIDTVRGIVKDFVTGEPIKGVRVSIRGIEAFSDQFGEFTLSIPEQHQRQFQTIRAAKEGYQFFELSNIAMQTDAEVSILLKPKERR